MPHQRGKGSLPPRRDWMAIFRATVRTDRFTYSLYAAMIVVFVYYCLTMYLLILRFWLTFTPTGVAHAVRAVIWAVMWNSFFSSGSTRMPPVSLHDLAVVLVLLLYGSGATWLTWMLGTYIRGVLEMHAYHRSPSPERLRWDRWLTAKLPLWISARPPHCGPLTDHHSRYHPNL